MPALAADCHSAPPRLVRGVETRRKEFLMDASAPRSRGELALDEASRWLVGGAILILALAPLALPGLVLAAVLALPLLLLAVPVAAIAGAAALARVLGRRLRRLAGGGLGPEPEPARPRGAARRARPAPAAPSAGGARSAPRTRATPGGGVA
jgi:hypothetical protein